MDDEFVKHCKNDKPLVNKEYIRQLEDELPLGNKVAFLDGESGSGKSSSATVIARHFQSKNQLGAMLFCNNELSNSTDAKKMVKALVFNLCLLSYDYAAAVIKQLEDDQSLITENNSNRIFQILICELLASLDPIAELIVVVIDLEIQDKRHDSIKDMLSFWLSNMPSSMRLVVSSRESDQITSALSSLTETVVLNAPDNLRLQDTYNYCIRLLRENRFNHDTGSIEEAAQVLLDLSGCNFAWLVVAEHYFQMQTSGITIETIQALAPRPPGMSETSFGRLVQLIMMEYSRWPNADLDVLGLVLSAFASGIHRQTASDLADLIGAERAAVARALRQLGGLVSYSVGDVTSGKPRVGIFHKLLAACVREEFPDLEMLLPEEQLAEIRLKFPTLAFKFSSSVSTSYVSLGAGSHHEFDCDSDILDASRMPAVLTEGDLAGADDNDATKGDQSVTAAAALTAVVAGAVTGSGSPVERAILLVEQLMEEQRKVEEQHLKGKGRLKASATSVADYLVSEDCKDAVTTARDGLKDMVSRTDQDKFSKAMQSAFKVLDEIDSTVDSFVQSSLLATTATAAIATDPSSRIAIDIGSQIISGSARVHNGPTYNYIQVVSNPSRENFP
ncbi:hypothetical protein HK405_002547 [Cladochytrium tenue]|nr:hypothetical protein HK405_002547 [Cladochytrium tenue]